MLLVKVWVPKTHPSFEKRETVLQFFLVHKTPAAGRPPPNFRLHLTWYRRQLCSPDIFQNHRKVFCKLCKTSKKRNIQKTHYILAMEEKTHTTHKKLDLPHREEMRNFFMKTVFVVKFLLDWEIPFEPYQGNMKKVHHFLCLIIMSRRGMKWQLRRRREINIHEQQSSEMERNSIVNLSGWV